MRSLRKLVTVSILAIAALCLAFILLQTYLVSSDRFSFSIQLHSGTQEIRTCLPSGRYCLVVNTNYDARTFGLIPPHRQYAANVLLEVVGSQGLMLIATNTNYQIFNVNKWGGDDLRIVVIVYDLKNSDNLLLHLGHTF